ncbi:Coiled-coil domain-containing protein 42, partial [Globisporangium splendens]
MEPVVSGVSQISQSTLLLKERKEMREIDDALGFMKEEYVQRMEACETRQRELDRKQSEMKEQVTRFEKFIKENDTKRTRAKIKTKTEHRLAEVNEQRKWQLMQQLEKDLKERDALEKKRDQLLKYRQYLEAIVDASDGEYEEIGDILNRYATLVDTNNDLKGQVRNTEVETDQLRQKIRALKIEMQNLVLVQDSNIHCRESGQIVMTVMNLYNRCRLSLGDKLLLKVIASRIVDLDYIVSNYKEQTSSKTNNNTSEPNPPHRSGTKATPANSTKLPPLSSS